MQKERKNIFTYLLTLTLLLFSINTVNAQELSYTKHPNLDYIAINNENVSVESGTISVNDQDTVKIAGLGTPEELINIYIEEQTYETRVDASGNWFVLFSIQNLEEKDHTVEIKVGEREKEELITLSVKEVKSATTVGEEDEVTERVDIDIKTAIIVVLVPILLVAGWFLGTYNERRKDMGLD